MSLTGYGYTCLQEKQYGYEGIDSKQQFMISGNPKLWISVSFNLRLHSWSNMANFIQTVLIPMLSSILISLTAFATDILYPLMDQAKIALLQSLHDISLWISQLWLTMTQHINATIWPSLVTLSKRFYLMIYDWLVAGEDPCISMHGTARRHSSSRCGHNHTYLSHYVLSIFKFCINK